MIIVLKYITKVYSSNLLLDFLGTIYNLKKTPLKHFKGLFDLTLKVLHARRNFKVTPLVTQLK